MCKQSTPYRLPSLAVLALAALVPACNHGNASSSGSGSGGGSEFNLDNLSVDLGPNFALVQWDTTLVSGGRVDFGTSSQYSHSAVGLDDVTHHRVLLTGLLPSSGYHFNASSSTQVGDFAESGDTGFDTLASGTLLSDDFNSFNLNRGLWSYEDPHERGQLRMEGAGSSDAVVALEVPANVAYGANGGHLRLTQSVRQEVQGEWETKLQNPFDVTDGEGGIFVESWPGTYMTFGFLFDGEDLLLQGKKYSAGNELASDSTWVQSGGWSGAESLWLRVTHDGPHFVASYSTDGLVWFDGPQLDFVSAAFSGGLYAGNGPLSDGAFILEADYIYDNAYPLPFEDMGTPDDSLPPYVYRWQIDVLSNSAARLKWWSDELGAGIVRWGLTTDYQGGSSFVEPEAYVNEGVMPGLDPASLYHVQTTVRDVRGHEALLPEASFHTNGYGSIHPAIRVWNGWQHETLHHNFQVFGENGNAQDRINVVGRVYDEDEDRIALSDTLEWSLNGADYVTTLLGDDRSINNAPWRLSDEGDFNIVIPIEDLTDAPIVDGYYRNELLLRASDDDGHEVFHMVIVSFDPDAVWPREYTTDFEASALHTKHGLQFQVQVVDGEWQLDQDPNHGFALRTNRKRLGYDRIFAIGQAVGEHAWDNYEATIPFTVMGFDQEGFTPGTHSYAFGVINRWNGHQEGGEFDVPLHGLYPMDSLFTYRWYDLVGGETWEMWVNENNHEILGFNGPVIVPGTSYVMKVRVQTLASGEVQHDIKVWLQSDPEPTEWTHNQVSPAGGPETGSLAIFAHHVDLIVGDISVTGL